MCADCEPDGIFDPENHPLDPVEVTFQQCDRCGTRIALWCLHWDVLVVPVYEDEEGAFRGETAPDDHLVLLACNRCALDALRHSSEK